MRQQDPHPALWNIKSPTLRDQLQRVTATLNLTCRTSTCGLRSSSAPPIRIDAKRQALDALDNLRRGSDAANSNGKPANDARIAMLVEVADDLTS
jgi:hypothetical protein